MCIDFRKLNDLQPEICCADSQTGGNISLVPLPKINEMYGRLKGAKYFTTLIGTVYPNILLSSASLHGHPQSSLGATLGVRMSTTAYGNHSTVSSVWPIGASRLNLRPRPLSI